VVAAVAGGVYVAAAAWLYHGMHYEIGDAIARTSDARAMLFSRDPHLAAMGFVWLPFPVFAQLPAMLVLSPLNQAGFAGPLTTAIIGVLTVYVVACIARSLNVDRAWAIVITLSFALNPVAVFTAANGMSEELFWFGAAVCILYLCRWMQRYRAADLGGMAFGGAICAGVRYESLPFILIIAALAALAEVRPRLGLDFRSALSHGRRAATVIITVLLGPLYVLFLWTIAQVIIERDPLYWLKAQQNTGHTPSPHPWLPRILTTGSIVHWTVAHVAVITPGAILFVIPLVARRPLRKALFGGGIVLTCWFFPVLTAALLVRRSSSGDPRYLEPEVLFVTFAGLWLVSEARGPGWRLAGVRVAVCAVLALGAVTATAALSNPNLAYVEQVDRFFTAVRGEPLPTLTRSEAAPGPAAWQPIAADIDHRLHRGDRVIIDDNVAFPLFVYTRYPDHYLISSDRDYQSVLADSVGKFDYAVEVPGSPLASQISSALSAPGTGGAWAVAKTYYDPGNHQVLAELWALRRGSAVAGQEGGPTVRAG
jgi:hypothetical protein